MGREMVVAVVAELAPRACRGRPWPRGQHADPAKEAVVRAHKDSRTQVPIVCKNQTEKCQAALRRQVLPSTTVSNANGTKEDRKRGT